MKKFKITTFLIFSFLVLGSGIAFCEPAVQPEIPASEEQVISGEIPETIPEKNAENLKKIKDSAFASKFVNGAAIILTISILVGLIILILKFYKKFSERTNIAEASPKETLATPDDFKTAINLFLEKTDE